MDLDLKTMNELNAIGSCKRFESRQHKRTLIKSMLKRLLAERQLKTLEKLRESLRGKLKESLSWMPIRRRKTAPKTETVLRESWEVDENCESLDCLFKSNLGKVDENRFWGFWTNFLETPRLYQMSFSRLTLMRTWHTKPDSNENWSRKHVRYTKMVQTGPQQVQNVDFKPKRPFWPLVRNAKRRNRPLLDPVFKGFERFWGPWILP